MLPFVWRLPASFAFTLALLATLAFATQAAALSFVLNSEFDGDLIDDVYATVTVTQSGDDLDFSVMLNDLLGPGEDAHELYFNLAGTFTGISITSSNAPNTAYSVLTSPSVAGV